MLCLNFCQCVQPRIRLNPTPSHRQEQGHSESQTAQMGPIIEPLRAGLRAIGTRRRTARGLSAVATEFCLCGNWRILPTKGCVTSLCALFMSRAIIHNKNRGRLLLTPAKCGRCRVTSGSFAKGVAYGPQAAHNHRTGGAGRRCSQPGPLYPSHTSSATCRPRGHPSEVWDRGRDAGTGRPAADWGTQTSSTR